MALGWHVPTRQHEKKFVLQIDNAKPNECKLSAQRCFEQSDLCYRVGSITLTNGFKSRLMGKGFTFCKRRATCGQVQ